jgi:ATP-binding cassette, subfamily B (MDR/TAP), member 1
MSVIIATISITMIAPYTISFGRAATAASQVFALIDRVSAIDPFDQGGEKPATTEGVIDVENVTFSYPTRPGVTILDNFSLHVPAGKVTALVVSNEIMASFEASLTHHLLGSKWLWKKYHSRSDREMVSACEWNN